jgi:hypothetical protein
MRTINIQTIIARKKATRAITTGGDWKKETNAARATTMQIEIEPGTSRLFLRQTQNGW